MISIQENIKLFRKAFGITQRELADLLGVTGKTVERYETSLPPKGKTLLKLGDIALSKGRPELAAPFYDAHKVEFEEMQLKIRQAHEHMQSATTQLNQLAANMDRIKRAEELVEEFVVQLVADESKLPTELFSKYFTYLHELRSFLTVERD